MRTGLVIAARVWVLVLCCACLQSASGSQLATSGHRRAVMAGKGRTWFPAITRLGFRSIRAYKRKNEGQRCEALPRSSEDPLGAVAFEGLRSVLFSAPPWVMGTAG
ncbi:hypothetical protein BC834DRAFT_660983 [Gloeopeniophorella convolvens]|nr:hypothetical protein BC834DRAFT_660983 [Gloeopeniophorella convolvens]